MEVHVRSRREAVAAVRSSGGPLTDSTPALHPLRREALKMPPLRPLDQVGSNGSVGWIVLKNLVAGA